MKGRGFSAPLEASENTEGGVTMTLNTFMKAVKEKLDLREVVEYTGVKLPNWRGKKQILIRCPFHDDINPSLALYHDHYYCFSCRTFGDHLTWFQKYLGLSFNEAIKVLSKLSGVPYSSEFESRKVSKSLDLPTIRDIVEKAHAKLLELFEDYTLEHWFIDRGFVKNEEEAISFAKKYRLGVWLDRDNFPEFYGYLIIPYFNENGEIIWFNARNLTGVGSKYRNAGGSTHIFNTIAKDHALEKGFLLIAEGELDCISVLESMGDSFPTVAIPGSSLSENIKKFLREIASNDIDILILMDPDDAGRRHAQKIKEIVREVGGRAIEVCLLTPDGKAWRLDVNDALKTFGKTGLEQMINYVLEQINPVGDVWFITRALSSVLEERQSRPVYPTGFQELDNVLGGGYTEGLHIIGGITKAGKTSLALKIAIHNALERRPVLYFTYEMSKFELWSRIISTTVSDVYYSNLKKGLISFDELKKRPNWSVIEKIAEYLKILEGDEGMINPTFKTWTVDEIEIEARRVKAKVGLAPLIVIDYLQRMPVREELQKKDIRERIDSLVTGLQTQVARGVGCPVIVLSSVSRAGYKTPESPEARLAVFKESGGIEYTGYTVILLYTLSKDSAEKIGIGIESHLLVAIDVLKNRENGETRTLIYEFDYKTNDWFYRDVSPDLLKTIGGII